MTTSPHLHGIIAQFALQQGLPPGPQASLGDFFSHLVSKLGTYGPTVATMVEDILRSGGVNWTTLLQLVEIALRQQAAMSPPVPLQPPLGS